jgi:hypothetical protein
VNINFLPFLIVWVLLALTVVVLFLYHRNIARQEDAHMDVLESAAAAQQQIALDQKLEVVDKWGKILTVIALVSGILLAGLYFVQTWEQSSRAGI